MQYQSSAVQNLNSLVVRYNAKIEETFQGDYKVFVNGEIVGFFATLHEAYTAVPKCLA